MKMEAYQKAYACWKQGDFSQSREILETAWQKTRAKSIYGMLLMAYLLRDEKKPVSELRQLQELLTVFDGVPEKNALADAWSLCGAALRLLGENRAAVDALLHSSEIEPAPA